MKLGKLVAVALLSILCAGSALAAREQAQREGKDPGRRERTTTPRRRAPRDTTQAPRERTAPLVLNYDLAGRPFYRTHRVLSMH